MNSTLRNLVFWMVLVVIGALVWHLSTTLQKQPAPLAFSDFIELHVAASCLMDRSATRP